MSKYLEKINIKEIKDFTRISLEKFGDEKTLEFSERVCEVVWKKFENLNYINSHSQQNFVDFTISACLLHNLFYREEDITSILQHRVCLKNIVDEVGIDIRVVGFIYELIESQLGENHPIAKLKPQSNSPASTMADAIWYVRNFS